MIGWLARAQTRALRRPNAQCTRKSHLRARTLTWVTALAFSLACEPDASDPGGAVARAVAAASRHDSAALFRALDQRARFALAAICTARREAAAVIQRSYPEAARAEALASLGDARDAESPEALLARRCPDACMDALAARLSAPRKIEQRGELATIETVRGERL
jgi:hypothetical protein